ncbi:DUF6339 family protein [Fibrobacter sp.]
MSVLQRTFSKEYTSILKQKVRGGDIASYSLEKFEIEENGRDVYPLQNVRKDDVKLDASKSDFDNAVLLYESFESLPPFIASEEALWAYLTHVEHFDYVKERWNFNSEFSSDLILKRFFYSSSIAMDNAISRLWWGVHLTKDESLEDPYKYTRVLLGNRNSDLLQNLSKSKLFRYPEAVKGIMKFFSEYDDRTDFSKVNRFIIQYFNRLGGVKQLVYMEKEFYYETAQKALVLYKSEKG